MLSQTLYSQAKEKKTVLLPFIGLWIQRLRGTFPVLHLNGIMQARYDNKENGS